MLQRNTSSRYSFQKNIQSGPIDVPMTEPDNWFCKIWDIELHNFQRYNTVEEESVVPVATER